ncbi:MAG: hypothetical protein R3B90_20640 [Planctomycetaceae bacterium]
MYVSATGDNYDASRLLLTDRIEQFDLQGDPVAMVPNRDTLLVTGSEDEAGLALMGDVVNRTLDAPRSMCGIPMRLRHGEWETWLPPPGHPQHRNFRLLEIKSIGGDYAEQKSLLDALYLKRGVDRFVATYSAVENHNGDPFSYCLWSRGIAAELPRAEFILFYRDAHQALCGGPWEEVAEIVGDLLEPLDTWPPRYRVQDFPTSQQLKAIGNIKL